MSAVQVGDLSDDVTLALYSVVQHAGLAWLVADAGIEHANALVNDGLARREGCTTPDGPAVRFWPTTAGITLWQAGAFDRAHELLGACDCCPAVAP